MGCLYHYCSTQKCFSILNSRTLRLSDLQKSNDYRELSLFFPELLYEVEDLYREKPYHFKYKDSKDEDAFRRLSSETYKYWRSCFSTGSFSNFVICFSEAQDSLSQWRGYADNGRGCCIGFSKKSLMDYCKNSGKVLRIAQVEYISEEEKKQKIRNAALYCIRELQTLREWIVENITGNDNDPDTDGLLLFNYIGMLESIFTDTLRYKSNSFKEEHEWRIYFPDAVRKVPKWLSSKMRRNYGWHGLHFETEKFLSDNVKFHVTDDDIIPFCPISFDNFDENPVVELWTGPKNNIRQMDIELFLKLNGYESTKPYHSLISYC